LHVPLLGWVDATAEWHDDDPPVGDFVTPSVVLPRFGQGQAMRRQLVGFMNRLIDSDTEQLLYQMIWRRYSHSIRTLIDNRHVFQPFWDHDIVPIVIHLMMENPRQLWGDPCYPVVD
jgi:hypothetical protein